MFHPTRSTSRTSSSAAARIALLSLLAFALAAVGFFARPFLATYAAGALAATSAGSDRGFSETGDFLQHFRSTSALIGENKELRAQLEQSKMAVLDRNELYEENLDLKERLGRSAEPNAVLAAVLVRPPETPYDTLLIDIGADHGVSVGDRVTAGGSLRIGAIDAVYDRTASVRLYSSPGEPIEGLLRGSIPVVVEGQGGGSLRAQVPYDAGVVEGDEISLPGIEANVAFIVEHVQQGHGDSATYAYLRLPVSPFSLRFVEVWRQK